MRYAINEGVSGGMIKSLKKIRTKLVSISSVVVLIATTLSSAAPLFITQTAYADSPIDISSVTDLRNAIENQANGQTWNIEPGNYGLSPFTDITAGCPSSCQTGWYMPITASNITINGIGNPTIYGTGYTADGNWSTQNLMTIFGDGVTINGVTLMPKIEPNKTIEVLGSNDTIENTTIEPNTLTDPAEFTNSFDHTEDKWGGSIYYNNASGTQTLENVTIYNGGISDHAPGATLSMSNVNLDYATAVDWINGYRFATHGNPYTGTPKVTYHVSSTLNNLDDVLANIQDSDTLEIDSNLSLSQQLTLTKSVTLNGNGHTISPTFSKTDNSNNSALGIQANNVTVNNLVEDGTSGTNLHGINVYDATGVDLNNVTVENNNHTGLNVDGSSVTVDNLTTANDGWDGVDVDKAGAVLTVNGTSQHTETAPDIYVDDASVGKVVDNNNQYAVMHPFVGPNDSAYNLKPATPTLTYPANNSFINTNDFWFDWNDVPGATSYEFQASQSPSVDGSGSLNNNVWTGDYQHKQPTASTLHSVGASGTWYWQVRAVDAKGVKSDWSAVWKMTIDMTPPAAPVITSPSAGQYFSSTPILDAWNAVTKDVNGNTEASGINHYQVAYLYDDGHTFGGSTCAGVQIGGKTLSGCRDVTGTSRNHTPAINEQGGVTIWVRAFDGAGNVSAWSSPVHYYYDATVLSAPNLTSPSDGAVVNGASLTNSWSSVSGAVKYEYESFNSTDTSKTPRYDNTYNTTSKTATNVTDGTVFYWRVRAIDQYGKSGPWSSLWKVTVDNTAPVVAITAPSNNSFLRGTVTISGTVTDTNPDHYYLVVMDSHGKVVTGPGVVYAAKVADYKWDTTTVADGNYTIDLEARDAAGNKDAASTQTVSVTVDNTAPLVNINDYSTNGNVITPSVTATDPAPGTNLTYAWTANDKSSSSNINISDPTALEPDFTVNADGSYSFTLTVTDQAGNSTAKTFNFTYTTPQTQAPTNNVLINTQNNGSTPNTNTPTGNGVFSNVSTSTPQGSPQVLGASTNTPSSNSSNGQVKGDSTTSSSNSKTDSVKNSGSFLDLGWWWLLILAIAVGLLWLVLGRRSTSEQ